MGSVFRLLVSILMSLNMETKLALLNTKLDDWNFKGDTDVHMHDLVRNVIYFDLTRNYELTGQFKRFDAVIDLLKHNPHFCTKSVINILAFTLKELQKKNTPSKWNLFGDKTRAKEITEYLKEFEEKLAELAVKFELRSYEIKTWIENPMTQLLFVQSDLFHYILDD
jgi:hypothetical protein